MPKLHHCIALGAALLIGACDAATPDTPTANAGDTGDDGLESSTGVAVVAMGAFPEARLVEVTFAPDQRAFAWRWSAQAGDVVRLATNGVTPADLDTVLKVYPSLPARTSETPMARNDDCDASTRDACLTLTAPNTQDYFVVVHRKDLGTSGTVRVLAPSDEPLVVPVTIDEEGLQHSSDDPSSSYLTEYSFEQIHDCTFQEFQFFPSVYPRGLILEARFASGAVFVRPTNPNRVPADRERESVLFEFSTNFGPQNLAMTRTGSSALIDDAVHGFLGAPSPVDGEDESSNSHGLRGWLKLGPTSGPWLLVSLRLGIPAPARPIVVTPAHCMVTFERSYEGPVNDAADWSDPTEGLMPCSDYDAGPFRVRWGGGWPIELDGVAYCHAPLVAPAGTHWPDTWWGSPWSCFYGDLEVLAGDAPAAMCAEGGKVYWGGTDDGLPEGAACNGLLEPAEVDGFRVACNGQP